MEELWRRANSSFACNECDGISDSDLILEVAVASSTAGATSTRAFRKWI